MFSPFLKKLSQGADLTAADRDRLTGLAPVRQVRAREYLIRKGERPEGAYLVLDGFACRYKVPRNGRRQIVSLLLPGDLSDLHGAILCAMDHGIQALSPCVIAELPHSTILDLIENYPRIGRALRWSTLVEGAILREWLVSMGRREAPQKLAHLFCELLVRLQVTGVGDSDSYPFPLTQEDLSEVLGLSEVHINRSLQFLRDDGLIVLRRRRVYIPDVNQLREFCNFEIDYLHLNTRFS